jgi:glutamyl-tRNA reductase
VDYIGSKNITLINRSPEKAATLAKEYGLNYAPVEETDACIQEADIVITATTSSSPIILKSQLEKSSKKILIDLSIPYNIEATVRELEHIELLNVDELSRLKDETLKMREGEVPKAKAIIEEHIAEFQEWYEMRRNVPLLISLKQTLNNIEQCPLAKELVEEVSASSLYEQRIQKVINTTAIKLKSHNTRGCHFIQAINDFIAV